MLYSYVDYILTNPCKNCHENFVFHDYPPTWAVISLTVIPSSSNSTIVPLFEKMLSASDAGRIGRLVLPKACAEVSFLVYLNILLIFVAFVIMLIVSITIFFCTSLYISHI